MDVRSTPIINSEYNSHKNSETSISSEDLLTSSEHLFSAHDTIDLSPDAKQTDKDYVRISKQEYEEIKSRVSAIEHRLSREFTDVIPRVQPIQQVQNVYEQTLEEVAMLKYPNSDHLARRLSKELKIRPNEETKIIRSPSARKIGSIRRRSRENLTKIVRHKSWNFSSQSQSSQNNLDRFYPYIGIGRRSRTSTAKADMTPKNTSTRWDTSVTENSMNNMSDSSQKYYSRKRISLAADYNHEKPIKRIPARRSLNISINSTLDNTASENSTNNTLESSCKSTNSEQTQFYQNPNVPSQPKQKWQNAAAFFMDKTGEVEKSGQIGRPSVNKLRKQNAGAVLAKAKLFESSSDKSSERNGRPVNTGFARKPRMNGPSQIRSQKVTYVKPKVQNNSSENAPSIPVRNKYISDVPTVRPRQYAANSNENNLLHARKSTPSVKKVTTPQTNMLPKTPQIPVLKKPLITPKSSGILTANSDIKRNITPMRAVHISPRRRSPRQKVRTHHPT